jgi:transcription elongation factor GreA
MEKVPMTAEGHAAMMDEIKHLKSVERPRIIKAIEEARSHGDLSENAEYHAAKEQQGWTEARVAELEDKISDRHLQAFGQDRDVRRQGDAGRRGIR